MRELLKTYVRSLAEREHAADAPQRYQDLGTFVCWLLERRGFSLHYRTYTNEGSERRKSAGRQQYGTDIVATKGDEDGLVTLYRFVLKAGDIRRDKWQPEVPGSLPHDLWLAASQGKHVDRSLVPGDIDWKDRVCLVAVHNGDLDKESLGLLVETTLSDIQKRHNVRTDWWDADALVEKALQPSVSFGEETLALSEKADTTLFPPAARPFIELALASSRLDFDYRAVDLLLNLLLPPKDAGAHEALRLRRALAELSLFAGMLEIESLRDDGVVFPLLDTIERVLCRAFEKVRQIASWAHHEKPIRGIFRGLLTQYLTTSEALLSRLEPLLDVPNGLSYPSPSERVDHPLRALRISGYLATAGLAALDVGMRQRAEGLSDALVRLWRSNPAGCLHPVTDDQIIETSLVWALWLQCGRESEVADQARNLVKRFARRKECGLPMPGLWQQAKIPMDPEHLRTLVEVHGGFGQDPGVEFEDRGTTILPLALFLACRLAPNLERADLTPFLAAVEDDLRIRLTYPQSWQPPEDAASRWYLEEIRDRGQTTVYDFSAGLAAFLDRFEKVNTPLPKSLAEAWNLPVVDWMAWKLWRTPPPMARFIPTK